MFDIEYCRAKREDVNEIMSIITRARQKLDAEGIFQWDDEYPTAENISADIDCSCQYIGRINNRIVVAFAYNNDFEDEYSSGAWSENSSPFMVIHRLCVEPELQHGGIGKRTMEYIHNQLTSSEIRSIRLDAYSKNLCSVRLYQNLGYSIVGETHWQDETFYLMEKLLPTAVV